jgi:hypothetical protein
VKQQAVGVRSGSTFEQTHEMGLTIIGDEAVPKMIKLYQTKQNNFE